jgi:hypothetical protein
VLHGENPLMMQDEPQQKGRKSGRKTLTRDLPMDFPYKSKNKNKNVAIRDRLKTLLAGWSKFSCKAHEKWSERRLTCAVTLERGDC